MVLVRGALVIRPRKRAAGSETRDRPRQVGWAPMRSQSPTLARARAAACSSSRRSTAGGSSPGSGRSSHRADRPHPGSPDCPSSRSTRRSDRPPAAAACPRRTHAVELAEPVRLLLRVERLHVQEEVVVLAFSQRVEADARILVGQRRKGDAACRLHRQYPRAVERVPLREIRHLLRVGPAAGIRAGHAVDEETRRPDVDPLERERVEPRRRAAAEAHVPVGRLVPAIAARREPESGGVLVLAVLHRCNRVVVRWRQDGRRNVEDAVLVHRAARGLAPVALSMAFG